MTNTVHSVERWAVSSQLVTSLKTLGFAVGDNSAPELGTYGWQGEPDAAGGNYVPWMSISPMPGLPIQDTTNLADAGYGMWMLDYTIYGAGVTREQSERLLDRARNLMVNLANAECQGDSAKWRIQIVRCTSVGSNNRIGEAIPYHYTQTDTYRVWVTEG